jgi:hypothetical protein
VFASFFNALDFGIVFFLFKGMNVANAAKENGIKHMVFSGLKSAKERIGKDGCEHFDSKKRMHDYIMKQGACFSS